MAQLNRASDYGSEGCRFESYWSHSSDKLIKINGSLAQLNRASDYGSEGCRFESYMSHSYLKKYILLHIESIYFWYMKVYTFNLKSIYFFF